MDKDPWCCASDKLRISVDGFNQGCLITYRSMRYAVRALSREDALKLIESQIMELEGSHDRSPHQRH